MAKKVLVVLSGHGYWGEELIGPLETLDAVGYETATLSPSVDEKYVDPPLGLSKVLENGIRSRGW